MADAPLLTDFVRASKATMSRFIISHLGGYEVQFPDTIIGIAGSALALAVLVCPFVLIYRPSDAGPFGVLLLFALAGFYVLYGTSAFTEITAAVFAVGAFLLAAIVSIARIAEKKFQAEEPEAPRPELGSSPLVDPKSSGGKWSSVSRP